MADAVIEGRAMRKELPEEAERERMTAIPDLEEAELSDEELMGPSTLAKIPQKAREIEVEEEVDTTIFAVAEEVEEFEDLEEELEEEEEVIAELAEEPFIEGLTEDLDESDEEFYDDLDESDEE